jgi:hypothetical protein
VFEVKKRRWLRSTADVTFSMSITASLRAHIGEFAGCVDLETWMHSWGPESPARFSVISTNTGVFLAGNLRHSRVIDVNQGSALRLRL